MTTDIEYDIVRAGDHERLIARVNDKIRDGWQPIGGGWCDVREWFYKAMVRPSRAGEGRQ